MGVSLNYICSLPDALVLSHRPNNTHGSTDANTHTHTFQSSPGRPWFAAKLNSVQAQVALDDMLGLNKPDRDFSCGAMRRPSLPYLT